MAGLLAWAADVVGGGVGGRSDEDNNPDSIPLIFTPEQQSYVHELDAKAASLNRSIQDLRMRLPPPDISQRLPHLHAHSLASNAALVLQLNAHSATKQQVQLREVRLLEENKDYENAISNCGIKIQEKLQEADALGSKLKEMELFEEKLRAELQRAQTSVDATSSEESKETLNKSTSKIEAEEDTEARKTALTEKLEDKRKELASLEDAVHMLEKKWQQVQDNALKQPTPGQREKALDKQLHSLIEQLAAKQAQAEGLVHEVHLKTMELEKANRLLGQIESSGTDINIARNRLGRSGSDKGPISSDYDVDAYHRLPVHTAGRSESLQRLMLLRIKIMIENGGVVDKISELPDDVLVVIISRLTWQEAIATSILSTRWRYLYSYIIRLSYNTRHPSEQSNFTYVRQLQEKEFPKYIKEISDFLNSNKGCGFLKEFRVHLPCLKGANIKTWLPLVLKREVESIDIRMIYHTKSMPGYYKFPCKTLIKKNGGGLGSFPGLKSLRSLSLHSLHVEDRDVELFVSNCTILECLSIVGSYKLKKVSLVGHSRLKRLDICSCRKASSIEVRDMINLASLTLYKLHPKYSLILDHVPKLIEFNSNDHDHLLGHVFPGISSCILDQLLHIEVHTMGIMYVIPHVPLLRNLKHIKLRLSNINGGNQIPVALRIPWYGPSLQKFEIKLLRRGFEEFDNTLLWIEMRAYEMGVLGSEPQSHLKEVTISGFTGSMDELTFTCVLVIRAAKRLEQLIVQPCEEIRYKAAAIARRHFLPITPRTANLIIM